MPDRPPRARTLLTALTLAGIALPLLHGLDAAPTVTLTASLPGVHAGKSLEYMEDPTGNLGMEDLRQGTDRTGAPLAWRNSTQDAPGFGFTRSVYWFRWTTKNAERFPLKYYIEVDYPVLDHLTLYSRRADGSIAETESGDMHPFGNRDLGYRNVVFIERAEALTETEHYLRVQTSSTFIVPVVLWTPEEFTEHVIREDIILGLFYGSMAVMLVYNLFIFASVRDPSYLFYVGYILFWSLFLLTFNGLGFQFFWPDAVWWANHCLNFFAFLTLACMQLFAISYLNTAKNTPILHRALLALLIGSALGVGVSLVLPYAIGIRFVSVHAILTVIVILTTAARAQLHGYRPARYFLLAWTLMLLGLLVLTLRNFAILPDTVLTRWSSQFGSALEVVFLALGLADRINVLKQEKIQTERTAYESKLRLLDAFGRFVPNQFLSILGKESVEDIGHGDSVEKQMTVLFSDIRNFTGLSEKLDATQSFRFLNAYLSMMGPVIINHRGFIDKFIGDAVMALFPEDPADAVRCAIELRQELSAFNEIRTMQGRDPVEIGIGIHCGSLMLGTVGSEERLETTVIGDTVNLSSRLESLTKVYRSSILISGDVREAIRDRMSVKCREIDRVRVRGRNRANTIFEVFEADPPELLATKERLQPLFDEALQLYRAGDFETAKQRFQEYKAACPADEVGTVYVQRCTRLQERRPRSWQGIVRLRY